MTIKSSAGFISQISIPKTPSMQTNSREQINTKAREKAVCTFEYVLFCNSNQVLSSMQSNYETTTITYFAR